MKKLNILLSLLLIILAAFSGCKGESTPQASTGENDIVNFPGMSEFKCVQYGDNIYYDHWSGGSYSLTKIPINAQSMAEGEAVLNGAYIIELSGSHLLLGENNDTLVALDLESGKAKRVEGVRLGTVAADSGCAYYLSSDKALCRFDLRNGQAEVLEAGPFSKLKKGDGRLLACSSDFKSLYTFDIQSGTLSEPAAAADGQINFFWEYDGDIYYAASKSEDGIGNHDINVIGAGGQSTVILAGTDVVYDTAAVAGGSCYIQYLPKGGQRMLAVIDQSGIVSEQPAAGALCNKAQYGDTVLSWGGQSAKAETALGEYTFNTSDEICSLYATSDNAVILKYPFSLSIIDLTNGKTTEIK